MECINRANKTRLDILTDIRETESPGRRGGVSPYAQAIYGYYTEIEELLGEGFTMATICRFFERKNALPDNADIHSFRRAFRREQFRRKKAAKQKEVRRKNAPDKTALADSPPKNVQPSAQPQLFAGKPTAKTTTGLKVNPDNTFVIRGVDPDDLPEN